MEGERNNMGGRRGKGKEESWKRKGKKKKKKNPLVCRWGCALAAAGRGEKGKNLKRECRSPACLAGKKKGGRIGPVVFLADFPLKGEGGEKLGRYGRHRRSGAAGGKKGGKKKKDAATERRPFSVKRKKHRPLDRRSVPAGEREKKNLFHSCRGVSPTMHSAIALGGKEEGNSVKEGFKVAARAGGKKKNGSFTTVLAPG